MLLFDPNMKFYKGNTHAHSTNSDGSRRPEEVMRLYREAGYDFLALTDHWYVGAQHEYEGMLVIPGVEYNFDFKAQTLHLVCLFRRPEDAEGIVRGMPHMEVIRQANAAGGVCIAAHPAWSLNTPDFLASLDGVELCEVYNTMSDEPYNGPRGNSESLLDVTAANGKLFGFVAADDSHPYIGEQCVSYTMVQASELSTQAIFDALRAGRFYASQGPAFHSIEIVGRKLRVETSPVCRVTFCSNQYWVNDRCRTGRDLTRQTYDIQPGDRFVRVQITDEQGRRAWSSPIAVNR